MTPLTPDQRRRAARDKRLREQYNISADEWDIIFALQGGVCAICKRNKNSKGLPATFNTDHDHKTGLTRGILCVNCNKKLNEFWTLVTAEAVFKYLSQPPATLALGGERYGRKGRITNKRRTRRTKRRKS